MNLKATVALMLISVMLAGCSKEEAGPTPEELCDGIFADGTCTPHTEPSIIVDGIPDSASAFISYPFTWTLDNGTRGAPANPVHSMYSYIGAVLDGTIPTNVTDPEVTPVGTEIALKTHQNLPVNLTGSFTWDTAGDSVVLWGYMRIDNENVWQLIKTVEVIEAPSTGVTNTVTIGFDVAAGGATVDVDELSSMLGDGVAFSNTSPYAYSIDLSACGLDVITVNADTTSTPIVFTAPQVCAWTGSSPLSPTDNDPLEVDGTLRIKAE